MQGDPRDEPTDAVPGAPKADDGLTPEEWAELERLTDPQPGPVVGSVVNDDVEAASPNWHAIADSVEREASDAATAQAAVAQEAADNPTGAPVELTDAADVEPAPAPSEPTPPEPVEAAPAVTTDGEGEPGIDAGAVAVDTSTPSVSGTEGLPDDEDVAAAVDEAVTSLNMALPRVIAVANQKGGVGKTTTTVNIAACLAEQGYRTLLVDLDPQANASTGVGIDSRQLEHSIYDVMLHDQAADSVIEPTEIKNLFVLPSSLDLAGAEIELVSLLSREHRLRLAIESVLDDYDYVLIDCPPSLGLLTINALTAAREVLVPIQCEYYALEGLGQLMRNVELVRASLNPGLQISHIVLVMFDPRTKLAGQVVDEVRSHFGSTVCENVIPRTVRLSEAPSFGQPITTFDSGSRGAAAYRAVTQEVLGGQA